MAIYDCATTWFSSKRERSEHIAFVIENFNVEALNNIDDNGKGLYGVHVLHSGKKEAPTDVTDETDG